MQKDTIIYVTDQRQKYLADMLGGEQTDCRNSGGIDYERVGNIVFPTPFSKLKLINSDIEKLKHDFEKWGGNFCLVLPDNLKAGFNNSVLKELPSQTKVFVDKENLLKKIESSVKLKLTGDYPIVTIINEKGEIIYLSKGYKIGTGEQLLKLL